MASQDDKYSPYASEVPGISRPLTPQECKELADSFADLPPEYRLSVDDLEMIQEEMFGPKAIKYDSSHAGIEAMKRRLKFFKANKARALNTLDDCAESVRPAVMEALNSLNKDIAATEKRLEAYEFQQRNKN